MINKNKILICDDQKIILDCLEKILNSIDTLKDYYDILKVTDGAFVLNEIIKDEQEKRIKIVFIDENMEFLNGSETIQIIRKLEKNGKLSKGIKYCSLTAFVDDEINSYKSFGFDEGISKPISKSKALSVLKEYKLL